MGRGVGARSKKAFHVLKDGSQWSCLQDLHHVVVKYLSDTRQIALGTWMKSSIVLNSFFINERFINEPSNINSFYERFFVHGFCYVLPLLHLHGAKRDCWPQWCHQSAG